MKLNNTFISTLACAFAVIGLALFSVSCEKDAGDHTEEAMEEAADAAGDAADATADAVEDAAEAAKPE